MNQERTLFVGWQDQHERRWYVVARLVESTGVDGENEYRFEYIGGAEEAATKGFRPFVAFPELQEVVRSRTLLPFFRNRIMPSSRPDYPRYLAQLGLAAPAEELAILARSGGQRTTERDEIEVFAPPSRREDGTYETHFFLRGIRHLGATNVAGLLEHERLLCMLDRQNEVNRDAVILRTDRPERPILVGYVPDYLCHDVATLLKIDRVIRATVAKVNDPDVPVQHRVLCRLELEPPSDYPFLSGPKFQPLLKRIVSQAA